MAAPCAGNPPDGRLGEASGVIRLLWFVLLAGPLTPVLAIPRLTALWRAHRILLDHADLDRRLCMIQP